MRIPTTLALTAALCATLATNADPIYTLTLKSGKIPADVKVENANGAIPSSSGYKRGHTEEGWTTGRFGDRGYVMLSPTFSLKNEESENILTLPAMEIPDGAFLRWDARSLIPERPETYSVEARAEGEETWTTLESIEEEKGFWRTRMASLSDYAGKMAELRFVCRSAKGYMLALDKVQVGVPEGVELICIEDNTEHFYGHESKHGEIKVRVLNAGTEVLGRVQCRIEGSSPIDGTTSDIRYGTGEEFELIFPESLDNDLTGEVGYKVYLICDDYIESHEVILYLITEGKLYCGTFSRNPLLDEGTGMWCNSCPKGTLELESLRREYGEQLITVTAHCNSLSDKLTTGYFDHLGYHAVPYMMLDRDKSTAGESTSKFGAYFAGLTTDAEIMIDDIALTGEDTAEVTATVRFADQIDNTADRYRIGYVVTADFNGERNPEYYQENSYNLPLYEQYYYLPSRIPGPLAYFHNVALTEAGAFDGLPESIPAAPEAMDGYAHTWSVGRPELLDDFSLGRIVAYVLDTKTGRILNATAARVDSFSGVERMESEASWRAPKGIFRLDGTKMEIHEESLPKGLYIIDGKKRAI